MHLLRLEDDGDFSLVEYAGSHIPRYAILSHTWGADHEEVTFKDLTEGAGKNKAGYRKLAFCGKQAAKGGLHFFWVDTCCIDKSSSAELSEAINSMFRWYHDAVKCYVYLSDVSVSSTVGNDLFSQRTWEPAFRHSRWFTRGWTLQELLAPKSVEFFSAEGERLGDKISLLQEIHNITGISIQALQGSPLSQFNVDERMSWAERRKTKREEDAAYSLLGIFDVHMPLIYGEGQIKAFIRLHKEIEQSLRNEPPALPPTLSTGQLKRKREPFSAVPFGRDPNFVRRTGVSAWIRERWAALMTRAAIRDPAASQPTRSMEEALSVAAGNGHTKVVRLLLKKGRLDPEMTDEHDRTPLSWAAGRGHEGVVKLLLARRDVNPDSADDEGRTPLLWAVGNGYAKVAKLLLEKGADINSEDKGGQTPLLWAAVKGHKDVVKVLLACQDVNVNAVDKMGRTPFLWAAARGEKEHRAIMDMILAKNRACLDLPDVNKRTPLSWATGNGHRKAVKMLLKENIDIRSKDYKDRTPLSWAAEEGHEKVVKLLLRKENKLRNTSTGGANLSPNVESIADSKDINEQTPILFAARYGHHKVVKLLLAASKATVNLMDNEGRTLLSWAAGGGHNTVVNMLLSDWNADANIADNKGQTPLSWAAKEGYRVVAWTLLVSTNTPPDHPRYGDNRTPLSLAAEKGSYAVVKLLLSNNNVNKDAKDSKGLTPLMWASGGGHERVVELLLGSGAQQDAVDSEGLTPLMWAAKGGNNALVELFLAYGAARDAADSNGWTPLMWALRKGHYAVVKLLLENGVKEDVVDNTGFTALMSAARGGNEGVVKLLLEGGAEKDARDNRGRTALMWASNDGHDKVVKLLMDRGADFKAKDNWGRAALNYAMSHESVQQRLKAALLGRSPAAQNPSPAFQERALQASGRHWLAKTRAK